MTDMLFALREIAGAGHPGNTGDELPPDVKSLKLVPSSSGRLTEYSSGEAKTENTKLVGTVLPNEA